MNIGNEERFHELAHKALANVAQPAEQAELRALIAENPKLKEEFEQMGAESAAAREILPLLEDLQHPHGRIPRPPMQRLQKEIREVFKPRPESQGEVRELLARLEKWAGVRIGAERERIMELISFLRESLSTTLAERARPAASLRVKACHYPLTTTPAVEEKAQETTRLEIEFEKRLRSLEARIRQAEEITRECREEVRGLLEALARERETSAERRGQNPNPLTKPKE
jgi:hypothetical protein